ncbi:hypothetical protein IT575_05640 [bacterium]|nr:hypothetical protein [bacterium]
MDSLGLLLNSAASLGTLAAALLAWQSILLLRRELETSDRFKRADLINELTRAFYDDEDLVNHFLHLSYSPDYRFDIARFEGTHGQPNVEHVQLARREDRLTSELLDLLNSVCFYVEQRMLTAEEIASTGLGYVIARVWRHGAVQQYIAWVDQPNPGSSAQASAFAHFRRHAPAITLLKYPVSQKHQRG